MSGATYAACGHVGDRIQATQCQTCFGSWCGECDPAPAALCHWCHGRGYSHAVIAAPAYLPTYGEED